jgi:hypothetical protein
MAISATHYRLFKSLQPILPQGGSLLEIGEANWYGDATPEVLYTIAAQYQTNAPDLPETIASGDLFRIAKAFYAVTFAPELIVSIDHDGTPAALRNDLNEPLGIEDQFPKFDLSINHGTAEHIFNVAQVFRTMHDHTVDGGLRIHDSPFTGWIDHGFYCLHPTLFYDLAAVNCYELVGIWVHQFESGEIIRLEYREHAAELAAAGKLPNNAMLFVVYRKLGDAPFKVPMQGYYAQTLSAAGKKAWEGLR